MELGICSSLYGDLDLQHALDLYAGLGIKAVEIYSGSLGEPRHIDVEAVLNDKNKAESYLDEFRKRGLHIGSLNCVGNPVHPDENIASRHQKSFINTVLLCEKLGVDKIIVFSGTPGGGRSDKTPNWITCPWPEEHLTMLDYQWNEVLVPYWTQAAAFAREHGIFKIGFEMHPGFCVYNPETLLKLRSLIGPEIGANFDPSHLMWQGMDPALAVLELNNAIFSVHAKDVYVNDDFIKRNGVNDAKHYSNASKRAWTFRTVGYGHGEDVWKRIISALMTVGYDGALNIEHEDMFMARKEGLTKAVDFLKGIIINEKPEGMWWA